MGEREYPDEIVRLRGLLEECHQEMDRLREGKALAEQRAEALAATLAQDPTHGGPVDEARRETEARFRLLFNSGLDVVLVHEGPGEDRAPGRFIEVNDAACRHLGYSREELLQMRPYDIDAPEAVPQVPGMMERLYREGHTTWEGMHLTKDGRRVPVEITNHLADFQGRKLILSRVRDITERKQAEAQMRRINRELLAISECSQAVVRATDEGTLLREVCRIVCEVVGYRMAWVGMAENDPLRTIRVAAWHGAEEGYFREITIRWDESEYGQGPAGTAIRTGRPRAYEDFLTDDHLAPWRVAAARRGYCSCVGLPLVGNGEAFGVVVIYSAESFAFTPEEVDLLAGLAGDLAFGILALRDRQQRRLAEAALRDSETRFRAVFENATDGIVVIDADARALVMHNRRVSEMLGYSSDELQSLGIRDLYWPEDVAEISRKFNLRLRGAPVGRWEFRLRRKDGTTLFVDSTTSAIDFGGRRCLLGIFRDVSERRQNEWEQDLTVRVLQCIHAAADLDGLITSATALLRERGDCPSAEIILGSEGPGAAAESEVGKGNGDAPLSLPLRAGGRTLGRLRLGRDRRPPVMGESARLFERLADSLALGVSQRLAAEALRKSEERFRTLVEHAGDSLIVADLQGNLISVNRQTCEELGYGRDELLRLRVADVEAMHDPQQILRVLASVVSGGPLTFDSFHRRRDGSLFPVEVRLAHIQVDDRPAIVSLCRDITARKRMERELRLRSSVAEVLLTVSDAAMYGRVLDVLREALGSPHGLFSYVNENQDLVCAALTQGDPDERAVVEKTIVFPRGTWAGAWGRVLESGISECVEGGLAVPLGHVPVERAICVPVIIRERVIGLFTLANKATPYDADDRALLESMAQFIAPVLHARLLRDREEVARQRAEGDLRETEERFATAMEATHDGVWDWRVDTGRSWFSPRYYTMLGYPPDGFEQCHQSWVDMLHPDDRETTLAILEEYLQQKRAAYEVEFRMRTATGSWRWILARGRAVARDDEGRPLRLVGTHVDITERKRAEEENRKLEMQLRQAQKMEALGQLAGGVAHDFNNLLLVISGFTDMTLDLLLAEDPRRHHLTQVKKAADRAAHLTRQLLAFSRKEPAHMEPLNLGSVARDMEKMLHRLIPAHIDLKVSTFDLGFLVRADRGQMEQVIMNLCINARDAMPEGGTLGLVVRPERETASAPGQGGPCVVLDVSDTGQGIPVEVRPRIFEPFFTAKGPGAGTGLGLATVYGIVHRHGGTVDFETELGRGTTFRVRLQVADGQERAVVEPVAAASCKGGRETVLLAEDEAQVRALADGALTNAGYRVLMARDGREALDLFERHAHEVGIAILDVVMPRMGGLEVFRELRRSAPDLPVVFCTGYSPEAINQSAQEPLTWVLRKPFDLNRLLGLVRDALDRANAGG